MEFSFGQLLKQLRIESEFSQAKLAQLLSTSQDTVSLWENGKSYPDFWNIKKIAEIFEVSADYLLGIKEY